LSRKHRKDEPPGVLDDLEDQAAWSSYTQHIPRGGNWWRQRIFFGRGYRAYRRLGSHGRILDGRGLLWALLLGGAFLFVVALLVYVAQRVLQP
jgi:hypothetical protein